MNSSLNSDSPTQVVILAGGLGTRLRPITEKIPKPLVDVAGHSFLDWQLSEVKAQGFTRVLLLIGYLGHMVQAKYGDGSAMGLEIDYSAETEPLGTGGALKLALPKLDKTFFLLNGDSFQRLEMAQMAQEFLANVAHTDALVTAYDNLDSTPVINNLRISRVGGGVGSVAQNSVTAAVPSGGWIVEEYKRGGGAENGYNYVDSGVYIIKKSLVETAQSNKFQLEQLWSELIRQNRLGAFRVQERFYDIGTPERLAEFERKIRDYFPNAL
jgi:NDP-sugar pyrophosphorylase family protein